MVNKITLDLELITNIEDLLLIKDTSNDKLYWSLKNYYQNKNINDDIEFIIDNSLYKTRLDSDKKSFLTLYINNLLSNNTNEIFTFTTQELNNIEKIISLGIDIFSPCQSTYRFLSNYDDTNVFSFLTKLNLKDIKLNLKIAKILYTSSFQSLENFYKRPDLQNYDNLSDNIIKYRRYLTKEEYSNMILNYTKFCPVSYDVFLSCADIFKDLLLSQKTFKFHTLTNYILKYESDNLNHGFIREQYKDLFNKFNMNINQELDCMKSNITMIKDYHILISHWEKHLLSQEINKSNNIISAIKNRL